MHPAFGIEVNASIVNDLSQTPQYSSLVSDIKSAVDNGLMYLDAEGTAYKFAHDKVRECAYGTIRTDSRDRFHFEIGKLLMGLRTTPGEEDIGALLVILDQVNHGVPALLQDESERMSIAKLNHVAASALMKSYNYTAAYSFAKRAASLLPADTWDENYEFSLKIYLLLSTAAYSCRRIDEAKVSGMPSVNIV